MKCIVNVCVSILLCVTVPALHWTVMALHLLYSTSALPFGLISHLLPSLWRGKYQMNLFSSAFWSSLCTRSHRLSLTVPFVYVFIMFCVTGTSHVDISRSVSLSANTVGGSVCPSPRLPLIHFLFRFVSVLFFSFCCSCLINMSHPDCRTSVYFCFFHLTI